MNKKNNNDSLLNGVCEFVNHLLKEVLAKIIKNIFLKFNDLEE